LSSLDDLVTRSGARRDELAALAEVGALNALAGSPAENEESAHGDRRSAI